MVKHQQRRPAEPHASNQPVPPPVYATKKDYLVDPAQLPGFKVGPQAQMYAGHLPVDNMNSTEFFVYHTYDGDRTAETKYGPKDLVVWLNGGPGSSSLLGFGLENGPVNFDANGTTTYNPYGWQKAANTLWLENPTGVGFSYTPNISQTLTSIEDVADQFWRFSQEFMKRFPETRGYRWWITGESYGGMYVPHIAHRILQNNDKIRAIGHSYTRHDVSVNLAGAYFSAYEMPVSWYDYLDAQGLLRNATLKAQLRVARDGCFQYMNPSNTSNSTDGVQSCSAMYSTMLDPTAMMQVSEGAYCFADVYDVRLTRCTDVDPTDAIINGMAQFLDKAPVQHAMHASAGDQVVQWQSENNDVYRILYSGPFEPSYAILPGLIERIPVLLYNGNKDVICNYIGQENMLANLTWRGHQGFKQTRFTPFKLNGKEVGEYKRERGLTSMRIYDAGHMVPYYQPEASLHLIKQFLRGLL
ncbi:hypothetical protein RI367_006485 [Sorochytrium milnesiophthora]